jgi:lipopolysaccharide export system protein LptA
MSPRPERARFARRATLAALAWLALVPSLAGAADVPAPSPSPGAGSPRKAEAGKSTGFLGDLPISSSDEPILVESRELEFDYQSNRVFYRGEVKAKQGDVTIDCDELIVFFDRADDVRQAELRAVVATGNVVITQGERRATGGKAVFNQVDRQIALLENPILRDGKNEVRGDRLTVYLDEGRSVMESAKGTKERVSAVLYPGSQSAKKEKAP